MKKIAQLQNKNLIFFNRTEVVQSSDATQLSELWANLPIGKSYSGKGVVIIRYFELEKSIILVKN